MAVTAMAERKRASKNPCQDDLLGEKEDETRQQLRRDLVLSELYPNVLKTNPKPEPQHLVKAAYEADKWCWPWYDEVDANIKLQCASAKDWLNDRKPDGQRRGYKTPDRGRRPFGECQQLELELDIWDKATQTGHDRDEIRQDIINFKIAFNATPKGPEGQELPRWIWSEEDDKMYNLIHSHVPAQQP